MPKYWKTDSSLILNNFSSNLMATLSCSKQGRLVTGLSFASKIDLNFWRLTLKMMCSNALHLCFLVGWRVSNVVVKAKVRLDSQLFKFSPPNLSPLDHTFSLHISSRGLNWGVTLKNTPWPVCLKFLTKKCFFSFINTGISHTYIHGWCSRKRCENVNVWQKSLLCVGHLIGQWARVQNSSFGDYYMTAFYSGRTFRAHSWSLHLESMNISQQILALDARYNAYRVHNNPQYRKYSEEKFVFLIQLTIIPCNISWILQYVRTYCF